MDHPQKFVSTSQSLTEIQAHKQAHKAQLMQADTITTTTTVTKPKPQDQDHGGDFPAS